MEEVCEGMGCVCLRGTMAELHFVCVGGVTCLCVFSV